MTHLPGCRRLHGSKFWQVPGPRPVAASASAPATALALAVAPCEALEAGVWDTLAAQPPVPMTCTAEVGDGPGGGVEPELVPAVEAVGALRDARAVLRLAWGNW